MERVGKKNVFVRVNGKVFEKETPKMAHAKPCV